MSSAIEMNDVVLRYSDGTKAVDGLDMNVKEGEFFGFLGPNGAGKTTTIKMLVTLLRQTSGEITVNGYNVLEKPRDVRKTVGYMPQETSIDPELTAYENLSFACDAYRVPRSDRKDRIEELLELVDLADVADKKAEDFSGGMKKRLDAATALVHDPPLVFLDEPTTGLDPEARNRLWNYFKDINDDGTTIFLTTQYLEEADYLCERIGIILDGAIEREGSPDELKSQAGDGVLELELESQDEIPKIVELLEQLDVFADADVETIENKIIISVQNAKKHTMKAVSVLNENNYNITGLDTRSPTLDDVFLEITGGTIDDLSEEGDSE
jgi:ABC-2 type transport system ATP-binding protein